MKRFWIFLNASGYFLAFFWLVMYLTLTAQRRADHRRVPVWAQCPAPWTDITRGDGRVVGAVCYVNNQPARAVWFTR